MARILVVGGNGFIGRAICKQAIVDGHEVRSVSRSGKPETDEPWVDGVTWIAADVFEPNRWQRHLDGCDALVHTIGIVREAPKKGVTFERMNGDSAIIAALCAERAGVPAFVFLSVMSKPPLVRDANLTAKRRAERAITSLDLRVTTIRLGPVYGPDDHFPRPVTVLLRAIDDRPWLSRRLGSERPVSATAVARVSLRAALGSNAPALLAVGDVIRNDRHRARHRNRAGS